MASTISIITVGNSGVGKSFLVNLIVGDNIFEHRCQANPVTTQLESVKIFSSSGERIVHNIPGLLEAKESNIKRNIAALERAFSTSDLQVIETYVSNVSSSRVTLHY